MATINNQLYNHYVSYFKDIAENHVDIQHIDEKGKYAFFRVSITEATLGYDRININVNKFILELIDPTFSISHNENGQRYRNLEGGFQILGHHKNADSQSQQNILSQSQEIAESIIDLMMIHSKGGHPLFGGSFDDGQKVNYNLVTYKKDANWAGTRVIFDLSQPKGSCIQQTHWINDLELDEYINDSDRDCIK